LRILSTDADAPDPDAVTIAITALRDGHVIAYLTDTLYGLGADARSSPAIARIFALKQRTATKPMPVLIADEEMLRTWVREIPETARVLVQRFWPGPLTLLFPAAANVPRNLTAGTGKIAIRVPGRSLPRELSAGLGAPIVATSANISGHTPAVSVEQVQEQFGEAIPLALDSGMATTETPSTILDVSVIPPRLVRAGAIAREELIKQIGEIEA